MEQRPILGGKRIKPLSGNATLQPREDTRESVVLGSFWLVSCALEVVGLHVLHLEYKTCGWNVQLSVMLGVTLPVLRREHCFLLTFTAPGELLVSAPFPFDVCLSLLAGDSEELPFRQRAGSWAWLALSSVLCTVKVIPKEQDDAEDN